MVEMGQAIWGSIKLFGHCTVSVCLSHTTHFAVRHAPVPVAVLLPAGGHRLPRLRHPLPRLLRVIRGEGEKVAPGESSLLLTLGDHP